MNLRVLISLLAIVLVVTNSCKNKHYTYSYQSENIKVKTDTTRISIREIPSEQANIIHPPTILDIYKQAYNKLAEMETGKTPMSFKKAVFITENAYFNDRLNYQKFNKNINYIVSVCKSVMQSEELLYDYEDKDRIAKFASIFKVMTDTFPVFLDSSHYYIHSPYTYDFDDISGEKDWSQMFVTKLLSTHKGNCHSLPFLYKIIAEELNEYAHLSIAPNHIYIKHQNLQNGWYNTELTSGIFPVDAWLMASGYIHLNAIKSGIYMAPLDEKQSIAVCITDLAKGYERKESNPDLDFILQCCKTALQYYPNYINALLLKADAEKKKFEAIQKKYGATSPSQIFNIPEAKVIFNKMEQTYGQIYKLGYRKMPEKMYLQWLLSLKEEKAKYTNKNISNFKN